MIIIIIIIIILVRTASKCATQARVTGGSTPGERSTYDKYKYRKIY